MISTFHPKPTNSPPFAWFPTHAVFTPFLIPPVQSLRTLNDDNWTRRRLDQLSWKLLLPFQLPSPYTPGRFSLTYSLLSNFAPSRLHFLKRSAQWPSFQLNKPSLLLTFPLPRHFHGFRFLSKIEWRDGDGATNLDYAYKWITCPINLQESELLRSRSPNKHVQISNCKYNNYMSYSCSYFILNDATYIQVVVNSLKSSPPSSYLFSSKTRYSIYANSYLLICKCSKATT